MTPPNGHRTAGAPLPLTLALRYLRSTRRDSFASFLSLVAVGGMALGVAALLLSLAALSGFQAELKREIFSRTPEIAIEVQGRDLAEEVREQAWRTGGVDEVQLTLSGVGWLVSTAGVQAVEMIGFEGDLPVQFVEASDTTMGLYVPESLASNWSLEVGDIVEVVSSRPTLTPFGPQPRVRRIPFHGTFKTGKVEHRVRCALPLAAAEALFGEEYRILVATGDLNRAIAVASELATTLPDTVTVRSWRDLNRALFFALRLEKAVMFLGVLLIIMVAGLALVSDLSLMIANKRREVGMLQAMGMGRGPLLWSFLLFGSGLSLTGIAIGTIFGLGAAEVLDRFQLLRLPESVYFLDYVPFLSEPLELTIVLGAAVLVAIGATFYSARGVLQMDPVEALRR